MTKQTRYIDIEGTGNASGGIYQQFLALAYLGDGNTTTEDGKYIYGNTSNTLIATNERDDTTGQYFNIANTTFTNRASTSLVTLGDYLYRFYDGGANMGCDRYDITSGIPTTETAMIVPVIATTGAGRYINSWTDGTSLYMVLDGSTNCYRMTISGTTLTLAATTATSAVFVKDSGAPKFGSLFDGADTYMINAIPNSQNVTLRKLTTADGSTYITADRVVQSILGGTDAGYSPEAVCVASTTNSGILYHGRVDPSGSATTTAQAVLCLTPLPKLFS